MGTVLVVDDKELLRDSVGTTLRRAGFEVLTAEGGAAALELIAARRPDAVVTDLKMPGMTGVELLEQVRRIDDDLPVVLMTAFGTVETAVKAIKLGAFDYITKPFEGDQLVVAVKRAIEHARLVRENAVLRSAAGDGAGGLVSNGGGAGGGVGGGGSAGGRRGLDRLVGDSHAMRQVKSQVRAVAESHGTVLICGESGTGKEVVARAIHEMSPRRGEAVLAVNCAALSEALLESELFGHERGSFTGAEKLRKGRFELADRGTLFLDEISEVSTRVQAKLLRVLQERSFERVGSSLTIGVDVRVIATSNRDLPASVGRGEFRQDLYYRLNVLPIHLPPLRERAEDVPALAEFFVGMIAEREGKACKRFDPGALAALMAYRWPGNVRELQNICERAAVLCRGETIERSLIEAWLPADWAPREGGGSVRSAGTAAVGGLSGVRPPPGLVSEAGAGEGFAALGSSHVAVTGRALEEIERDAIVHTLQRLNGHRQRTAEALGIGVRTLGLKLKKWKAERLVEQTL